MCGFLEASLQRPISNQDQSKWSRRSGYLGELVTHPAHGQDVTGILRIGLHLPSDISDVHVRCADLTIELSVPQLFHYLLAAIDPSGMGREEPEDLELCGGQVYTVIARPDLTAQKIDHEAGEREPLIRSVHAPASEMGPYAAHHLQRTDRFGDVVVSSYLEAQDNASFAVAGGQHDHRHVAALPEFLAEADPVDPREHYVQHDKIERSGRSKVL